MWNNVMLNCRVFACENNKEGSCLLNKIALTPIEDGTVGHLICNESKAREPATEPQPNPDE